MEVKNAIGGYYGLTGGALQSITKTLVDVRNACAHHTKLFDKKNWQIVKVPEIDMVV
jgi:abortive infection bacteriophage resistance protein